MRDFVGVTGYDPVYLKGLKRKVLLFDKIGDFALDNRIDYWSRVAPQEAAELTWLRDQGVIFQVPVSVLKVTGGYGPPQYAPPRAPGLPAHFAQVAQFKGSPDDLVGGDDDIRQAARQIDQEWHEALSMTDWTSATSPTLPRHPTSQEGAQKAARHLHYSRGPLQLRLASILLNRQHNQDACALFDEFDAAPLPVPAKPTNTHTVLQVVLEALPAVSSNASWDDVLAFRKDPAARDSWLRLRDWINDLGRSSTLTASEIEDKCASLMEQYRQTIKLHNLRTGSGSLQTFVTTTAEVAEALVKLQFSKLANLLFSVRRRRAELLHAERSGPGAAVSYIIKSEERFR